jgi:hypothetical protein
MVLMVADVEEKLSEGDLSTVELLAMATVPGNYSDVVEKAFSFDVLGGGNMKKSLAVFCEILEASGDVRRCVCAHLTLPASYMLASLETEPKKERSVLMRLPGERMLTNSPGELLP